MSQRKTFLVLLLVAGLSLAIGACKTKDLETQPVVPAPVADEKEPPAPPPVEVEEKTPPPMVIEKIADPTVDELNDSDLLRTVYFDFDKYELSETTRATIRLNADWLRVNPGHHIVIEGHCDERGSIEYNLALGERRANATREFLASLGAGDTDIRIVTYGEERPAVQGSNDSAWAKNRRAEFKFE